MACSEWMSRGASGRGSGRCSISISRRGFNARSAGSDRLSAALSHRLAPLLLVALAEELADGCEGVDVVAEDLERGHERHRDERAGKTPDPPPEREPDEHRDRVQR